MDIMQIAAVGVVGAVLSITIKKQAPETALIISIATSILIFFMVIPRLSVVFEAVEKISANMSTNTGFISIILKIIGVAYIGEFGSQICIDAGESSIASKIDLASKVIIMVMSMPIMLTLLDLVMNIV